MIKNFFLFYCLVNVVNLFAFPKELEVWFLSEEPTLFQRAYSLNYKNIEELSMKLVLLQNGNFHGKCEKHGNLFFHPQLGLHEHGNTHSIPLSSTENSKFNNDFSQSTLITCDSKNFKHFDYFCGKQSKTNLAQSSGLAKKIEVWVDTSSSFRRVDPHLDSGCHRKNFMDFFKKNSKINFYSYDIVKKEIVNSNYLCKNIGGNDSDRLLNWIKQSSANYLLIITDISELDSKFDSFIKNHSGVIKGNSPDLKLYAKDLIQWAATIYERGNKND